MNKGIYRLIWNRSLGALQVVGETATSKPCGSASGLAGGGRVARRVARRVGAFAALPLALAMGLGVPGMAAASTYTVTNNDDNGVGSLRSALSLAGAGDTVDLGSTSGAITNTSPLTVPDAVTVTGTGPISLQYGSLEVQGSTATLDVTLAGANGTSGQSATSGTLGTNALNNTAPVAGGNGGAALENATTATAGLSAVNLTGTTPTLNNLGALQGGYGGNGGNGGNGGSGGQGGKYTGSGTGQSANGGNGGNGSSGTNGASGGAGVSGTGFSLLNSGGASIIGGTGGAGGSGGSGGSGGTGGAAKYSGTTVGSGGNGGNGGLGGNGASGGAGVTGSSFYLNNQGTISGGQGGGAGASGSAGPGGSIGIVFAGISITSSNGTSGTAGAAGLAGAGGVGVIASGDSTIYNAGIIEGGLSGDNSTRADAIELSGGGNTLILETTSQVTGNIISDGGDTLTMKNGSVVNGEVHLGGSTLTSGNATVGTLVNDGTVNVGTSLTPILLLNVQNVPVPSPYAQLHVTGDYVQTNAGTLNINALSTSQYSSILVDGDAHLAGTLNVNVAGNSTLVGGNVLSSVISTSGDVIGTFDQITDNSQLFNFNAVYESDAVDLTAIANSTTGVQDAVEANGNKQAEGAAIALDQAINSNPNGALAAHFQGLTTSAQVASAASQTLPLLTSGSMTLASSSLNSINGVVESRSDSIRGISSGDNYMGGEHVWVKPFGSWANQDSRNGSAGYSSSLSGLAFGVDGDFSDRWTLGTALVYGNAESQTKGDVNQRMQTDVYQLVGYGTYHLGNDTDLSFQLDGGRNHNKGSRDIEFADLKAKSSYSTTTAHAGVQLDHTFTLNPTTRFIPAVRADYTWIKDDAYSEKGADALDLNANSRSSNQFVLGTHGKLSHDLTDKLTVNGKLGVGYDFLASRDSITTSFAGDPGVAFRTNGTRAAPWIVGGSTSLDYQLNTATKVSLRYDAEHRSGFQNQTASAEVRWAF